MKVAADVDGREALVMGRVEGLAAAPRLVDGASSPSIKVDISSSWSSVGKYLSPPPLGSTI